MKLTDILYENVAKKNYIKSLKETLSNYNPSIKSSDDSDFILIKLNIEDSPIEFTRFITNNTLNKTDCPCGAIKNIVDLHDESFAKKHNLRITGESRLWQA